MLSDDDRHALRDLVHRYAALVDARDLESAAALFTDDAVLSTPAPPRHLGPVHDHAGRAAIVSALTAVTTVDRTLHEVGTVALGDDATGRVACTAHHVVGGTDHVWHLHYDDAYRRTPDGWRLARRALTVDRLETRPVMP